MRIGRLQRIVFVSIGGAAVWFTSLVQRRVGLSYGITPAKSDPLLYRVTHAIFGAALALIFSAMAFGILWAVLAKWHRLLGVKP
jgi:hypothetical protein